MSNWAIGYIAVVICGAVLWVLESYLAKKDAAHQAELRARARAAAEERAKADTQAHVAKRQIIVPPRPVVRKPPAK